MEGGAGGRDPASKPLNWFLERFAGGKRKWYLFAKFWYRVSIASSK